MMRFEIDPQATAERIKPLHAVGAGPLQGGAKLKYNVSVEYAEIGVPFSRLHDVEFPYGGMHFIDVHCIFPDFEADVNDPGSYRFSHSDQYIKGIVDAGGKVFYRLGESIDHFNEKLYIKPPKDYLKWAQICEHIILHYNNAWNRGFYYNIEYWEIWNEPDNKGCQWLGTPREFYEFYAVTASYLKKRFPALKIGGYAALYRLGTRCGCRADGADRNTYILAATNGEEVAVLLTARAASGEAEFRLPASFTGCAVKESRCDAFDQTPAFTFERGVLKLRVEKGAIYEIRFK